FAKYWKALDAALISVSAGNDFELSLTLQGRPKELPAPAQKFLTTAAQPSELWQLFSPKPIIAGASRIDFEALLQVVTEFVPDGARPKLNQTLQETFGAPLTRDFVTDVLPCLGPDFGFCVSPPPQGKSIPDAVFALRLQPGGKQPPVDQAVFKALQGYGTL